MFLGGNIAHVRNRRFPRVRGDVPTPPPTLCLGTRFSPRARGCSPQRRRVDHQRIVFPACAGMFLPDQMPEQSHDGFPRVRGDVPAEAGTFAGAVQFSPRARGCSQNPTNRNTQNSVFPACAGMFRLITVLPAVLSCFPRVRGDVPTTKPLGTELRQFSPRARGCSDGQLEQRLRERVFPACAGMFLTRAGFEQVKQGFPRVRGDVPAYQISQALCKTFSPRARGCSAAAIDEAAQRLVFPACAGMFPATVCAKRRRASFPRVRGDVPTQHRTWHQPRRFSPRTRGCSFQPRCAQKY